MKALRKMRPARGANLESVPVPTPGPIEVLVRVRAASICGTDLHIYGWDRWSASRINTPMTFGHEFCGYIEKVGSEVTSVKPGDFVSAEMHVNCGHCRPCRMGQPHVCQNVKIIGIDADGCFAEYLIIPIRNIWKIDPAIPERYAAILDPLGNAVHTVMAADVSVKSVAITGVGSIGLMAIPVARAAGAAKVFAVDVNPQKLELAKRVGADATFSAAQPEADGHSDRRTNGDGVDVLLEMSGSGQAIDSGLAMVRNGGVAALLGIPSDDVEINLAERIIFKGLTVLGINGRKMFETWYQTQSLVTSGRVDLTPIITHEMRFEDFEAAFALMKSGEAAKIVLHVD